MAERLPVLYNKKPCYDIVFSHSFEELPQELEGLECEDRRICLITDSRVDELYGSEVLELLRPCCKKAVKYAFPNGEEHKTLDTVREIYRFLIEEGFDRKDFLVALGGGVVGDVTGYVAGFFTWRKVQLVDGSSRAYGHTFTAHTALRVVDIGHIVFYCDCFERAFLCTFATTDTSVRTCFLGYSAFVFVYTANKDTA